MSQARVADLRRRSEFLPFHKPSIDQSDIEAVGEALRSGWLTHGPICRRFEEVFAAKVGASRAVVVSSGTAAMHLALAALDIGDGDEVITTPFTFCATALVIEHVGATPVFVDIDKSTLQIDPDAIERAINSKTRAVLPVHYGGHPYDVDAVTRLTSDHGLELVEDAAHALGAAVGDRQIGSFGRATCFSFYATKNITTGEGGMIATDDEALAARVESLRLHGISRDAWRRYRQEGSWYYEVQEPGYKANLTDFQAALGLSQLRREPEMRARREAIARRYTDAFSTVPGLLETPYVAVGVLPAWHLYPLRLHTGNLDISRDRFVQELESLNVGTSVHFIPLNLHAHFRERFGLRSGDFPRAEDAYRRILSLPIYPSMTDDDVEYVIACVLHVARRNA